MKFLILIILFLFFPCPVSASNYVFVIDENSNPIQGYRATETDRDDIFISKIDPVKRWITSVRSQLIVVKNGYFYPVKEIIIDRKKGIARLQIDFSERKPLYFNPEEVSIDRSKKVLAATSEAKKQVVPEKEKPVPDYLALARKYENTGQWDRAVQAYEKLEQKNSEIIEKIGTLYYRLGKFKKAEEYFSKLPENETVVAKLAAIYIIEKEYESALKILQSHNFNSPYIHYLKGLIYYLTDRKDEAYREALILSCQDSNLGQNLRELLR